MAARARGPLSRSVAETATDLWNDSCGVAELEAAIALGAVGATANPTIVGDVWKGDPATWQAATRDLAAAHPAWTEIDLAWAHRRGHVAARGAAAVAGLRAHGRSPGPAVDADRSDVLAHARPDARAGHPLRRPGAEHHRQVPGDRGRHRRDGGGDVPRRQRQLHGQLQRQPGGRGGRGGRARAAPARGRGPAGRPDGPGHHDHDGPDRGLAAGAGRARRDRRRPGGPGLVRRRGLQAGLRDLPRARAPGPAARRGDPSPLPLERAHRRRRRDHPAARLAAPVRGLRCRGPAADGRSRAAGLRRRPVSPPARLRSRLRARRARRRPSSTPSRRRSGRCGRSSPRTTSCSPRSSTRSSRTPTDAPDRRPRPPPRPARSRLDGPVPVHRFGRRPALRGRPRPGRGGGLPVDRDRRRRPVAGAAPSTR